MKKPFGKSKPRPSFGGGPRKFDRQDRDSRGGSERPAAGKPWKKRFDENEPGGTGGFKPRTGSGFGGAKKPAGRSFGDDRPNWKSKRDWNSDSGERRSGYGDRPFAPRDRNDGPPREWRPKPREWDNDQERRSDNPRGQYDGPRERKFSPRPGGPPRPHSGSTGPGGKPRNAYSGRSYEDRSGGRYDDKPRGSFDRKPGGFAPRPGHRFDPEAGGGFERKPAFRAGAGPRSDRPKWTESKSFQQSKPFGKSFPSRPDGKPSYKRNETGRDRYDRDSVSVPTNKLRGSVQSDAPQSRYSPEHHEAAPVHKPFSLSPEFFAARNKVHDGPTAKALVITLDDTNNVPTRIVWVYESMVGALPDGDPAPGESVYVHDEKGRFLGAAIYNPHSRIRARIFSLTRQRFDQDYIRESLSAAIDRRKKLGLFHESCRVVFGESDGLPGLTADKIGNYLVIQPLTFAVDRHLPFIIDRLNELVAPDGIVVRRDVPIRAKEGLPVEPPQLIGDIPERVTVKEAGCTLFANIAGGQKTGLFLDQRFNRDAIKPFCTPGSRVLDLFCHVGGWALRASRYGASEVIGVDSSRSALDLAEAGARASGLQNVSFVEDDVFEYLRKLEGDQQFDIIISDPPAFAKTRQHYDEAFRAYLSLNYLVMKKLAPGGLLVSCSCSQAVSATEFNEAILTAARNARMQFQVLERRGAPPDHPVLLGLPETEYLKCFVLQRI